MNQSDEKKVLLLVEDDEADQQLVLRAVEEGGVNFDVRIVEDGEEALDYLKHQGKFAEKGASPRPHLILFDLSMPRMNGKKLLSQIRQNIALSTIPAIVFSTSTRESDIRETSFLGATAYISKPSEPAKLVEIMQSLESFWVRTAIVPDDQYR